MGKRRTKKGPSSTSAAVATNDGELPVDSGDAVDGGGEVLLPKAAATNLGDLTANIAPEGKSSEEEEEEKAAMLDAGNATLFSDVVQAQGNADTSAHEVSDAAVTEEDEAPPVIAAPKDDIVLPARLAAPADDEKVKKIAELEKQLEEMKLAAGRTNQGQKAKKKAQSRRPLAEKAGNIVAAATAPHQGGKTANSSEAGQANGGRPSRIRKPSSRYPPDTFILNK